MRKLIFVAIAANAFTGGFIASKIGHPDIVLPACAYVGSLVIAFALGVALPLKEAPDMGMDLQPIDPSPNAPLYDDGEAKWGRYNWTGWTWLIEWLDSHGVNTSEFAGCNDGEEISAETCKIVADTLRANLDELSSQDREWLEPHILLWATCGGYRQY